MLLSLRGQRYSTHTRDVRKRHETWQAFRCKRGGKGLHKTSPVTQHLESLSHMRTLSKHRRGQRKLTREPSKHCSPRPFKTANVCSGEAALKCQEQFKLTFLTSQIGYFSQDSSEIFSVPFFRMLKWFLEGQRFEGKCGSGGAVTHVFQSLYLWGVFKRVTI